MRVRCARYAARPGRTGTRARGGDGPGFLHVLDLRDDRLPRNEAEKRLTKRLGTPTRFSCKPMDEDASLAIPDADYFCQTGDVGYWIGTDEDRITPLQFAG